MSTGGSYDPRSVEADMYAFWEQHGHFHAVPDTDKPPYVIDIPLPNVTGALHLGHALNNTVQDILIRHKRMSGHQAMWMPGTDHAGIATQAVVEKRLKEDQNLTRHELGRDGLVRKIWEWKEEYGGRILQQLRWIGCSCDWDRTRFTLDEICAKAVYEVFFQWFKAGLIYRGRRLVNWDAQLQTAVSDDEIFHDTVKGHLWHYRYPVLTEDEVRALLANQEDSEQPEPLPGLPDDVAAAACARAAAEDARLGHDYLAIATTRPETMLGDTALAVHPEDERYQHLIGRFVLLPLQNRPIPVVADPLLVKREFGTACVKVTPGHDPNDYACAQRNNLPMINILTVDGKINDNGGAFAGLDRYEARKQVVAALEPLGILEKVEDYEHEVGHSDRSKSPIEPMLSDQWFVNMADLAENAMQAVRDGRVTFFPQRYAKTYLDWLGEKRDWCISRQLWWGHRIPVWAAMADDESGAAALREQVERTLAERNISRDVWAAAQSPGTTGGFHVGVCLKDAANKDAAAALEDLGFTQDPDVLDTWFSSALWPFSTLGWPDNYGRGYEGLDAGAAPDVNNAPPLSDLGYFYPTSTLVTAREIITLWVARMVMTGLYFMKDVPFAHVHIHPNIQDGTGRRMSKSAGNGVDPANIIEQYGADALRFTMAQLDTETQDVRLPVAYLCPHCGHLTPHSSAVPHNKVPADIKKVKCKGCGKEFATVWADQPTRDKLGTALDTSERFEQGRNFCNKIWQASTGMVIPNLEGYAPHPLQETALALEDKWILTRLAHTIAETNRKLASYQISDVINLLYAFFWSDFCDWYLELVKPRLGQRDQDGNTQPRSDASAGVARQVLAWVLDQSLRLLHPFMPFVTEALWKRLNAAAIQRGIAALHDGEDALILARWPEVEFSPQIPGIEQEMERLQDVIRALRDTRTRVNAIRAAAKASSIRNLPQAVIKAPQSIADQLRQNQEVIQRLGNCDALEIGDDVAKPPESASKVFPSIEVYVPLTGLADLELERQRLTKERDELAGHIERVKKKLANEGFVSRAPADVVQRERERLAEMEETAASIERNLADIAE